MDLWSKGLGRRVLSLRLGERDSLAVEGDWLVIDGVMHAPTYWDYRVSLAEQDVLEFLELLQRPDALRFLAEDSRRGELLRTAVSSGAVFFIRTLGLMISGRFARGGVR